MSFSTFFGSSDVLTEADLATFGHVFKKKNVLSGITPRSAPGQRGNQGEWKNRCVSVCYVQ